MLTKGKLLLFISSLLFLLVTGCDLSTENKPDFYDATPSVDLSTENLRSITFHSDEKNVREVFGEPNFINKIDQPKSRYLIYGKDENQYDVDFLLVDGKVKRYYIASERFTTARGISIGSRKNDIIEIYGEHFYETTDTGTQVLGYFDKTNQINLEFLISEDVVKGILVSHID